jgi:heme/copper-type cytochrome/quinol oxidase subunit 1
MTARVDSQRPSQDFGSTKISIALWFGVLGGPAACLVDVLVAYPEVGPACTNNSPVVLHVLTIVFLSVAFVAGLVSWGLRQRIGNRPSTASGVLPRSRFMATVGILTAGVSAFALVLQWIPIFFIGACRTT